MVSEQRLYINQLLNNYKEHGVSTNIYTVTYQYNDKNKYFKLFEHNEGIECVQEYIKSLENKIDELEYIQKIIDTAKIEPKQKRNSNKHGYWFLLDDCANAGVYCSVCHKKCMMRAMQRYIRSLSNVLTVMQLWMKDLKNFKASL